MEKATKKADLIIILAVIAAAILLFAAYTAPGQGKTVLIYHNGELLRVLPLERDLSYTLTLEEGVNTVVIKNGAVWVESADCGGDCVRSGAKSKAGSSIVCLPHRLVIEVSGEDYDAVSG